MSPFKFKAHLFCISLLLFFAIKIKAQDIPTPNQIFERYMQVSGDFSNIANTRILMSAEPINGNAMDLITIKDSTHRLYQKITLYEGVTSKKKKLFEVIHLYNRGILQKIINGKLKIITDKSILDQFYLDSYIFSEMAYRNENYKTVLEGIEKIK